MPEKKVTNTTEAVGSKSTVENKATKTFVTDAFIAMEDSDEAEVVPKKKSPPSTPIAASISVTATQTAAAEKSEKDRLAAEKAKNDHDEAQKEREAKEREAKEELDEKNRKAKMEAAAKREIDDKAREAAKAQAKDIQTKPTGEQPTQPAQTSTTSNSVVGGSQIPIAQQLDAATQQYAATNNAHPPSNVKPFVNSSATMSPSLSQRANELTTTVSEVNAHKYNEIDKNAIIEAIKPYGCTAEFPDNAAAKVSGPSNKLIQALKNCGSPEFAKGPFTLDFKVNLDNPEQIKTINEKINKLLTEAANAGVAITNITINKEKPDSRFGTMINPDTKTIEGVNFMPDSPDPAPSSSSRKK